MKLPGTIHIPLIDMVMALSGIMDLVNDRLHDHHRRVAYIAMQIAAEAGLSKDDQSQLLIAGALHDIGAISVDERIALSNYEENSPMLHARRGGQLLATYPPFSSVARVVDFHHVAYAGGDGLHYKNCKVPELSHILHIADRVEVLINRNKDVLLQSASIQERILADSRRLFHPEYVEAFLRVARSESFWLGLDMNDFVRVYQSYYRKHEQIMDSDELESFAIFLARVIDMRSRFTATHSSGVATVAFHLATLCGMSSSEARWMRIAGYLHDLGKLAIPVEILEKKGKLTNKEKKIIRKHSYYTYTILEKLPGLELINQWASFHHERLDGTGYPFRLRSEQLLMGSRIMSVADIFTAVTEDRPYREGMSRPEVIQLLRSLANKGAIDSEVVETLNAHYGEVDRERCKIQSMVVKEFEKFNILQSVC